MNATAPLLGHLKQQRPEWEPWLGVVEVALRECERSSWREAVPVPAPPADRAPRLAGATVHLQPAALRSCVDRLFGRAAASGTREMATLQKVTHRSVDAFALVGAALCQDREEIARAAEGCGADLDAFHAVAALLPVPLLHACRRSWDAVRDWSEPYCPICGSWPAFAEVRGIERSRHYRCGRCGSEWHAHGLSCPFCGTTDHRDLARLVPGEAGATSAIDACRKCHGYVKSFNRLQGCTPSAVLLEDLAGVALDLAAIEQGYSRPATSGYALGVTVAEAPARRRLLLWAR